MSLKAKPMPSLDYLNSILELKDGLLYNKITRNSHCVKGTLAGSKKGKYRLIMIQKKAFLVHRIAYFMKHGNCPEYIDHIDNNSQNNHIDNLRPATKVQNQWNQGLNKANTSGVKGLSWAKSQNKWLACIRYKGKNNNLGYFETKELGAEFLQLARELLHGNYANHGNKENIPCH
jgi:hypothetical protein